MAGLTARFFLRKVAETTRPGKTRMISLSHWDGRGK